MSPFRWFLIVVAMVAAGLCIAAARESEDESARTVKVASVLGPSHPSSEALHFFADRVEELSDGNIQVDVFLSSQLGSSYEAMELCRMGDLELNYVSSSDLTRYAPVANALLMPFIWDDTEHQYRMLDGRVGRIVDQHASDAGFEVLGYFDAGTRNITTMDGPIEHPDDLRGKRIRVVGSPILVQTINRVGGTATALNMGEVYTALQTGVIDGWENNPMTVVDYRMWETGCRYFAWTRHVSVPDMLLASGPFLESLSEHERQWLKRAATDTVEYQRNLWQESQDQALQTMRDNGMVINEVDSAAFQERVQPIYELNYQRYGTEFKRLCRMIMNN